jgi:hypothetical protein
MEKELILNILSYAIRAPSTHNSQPWLFKLQTNGVSIYYNKKLFLPEADHDGRGLYISIGCMLENMIIAATHFGISTNYVFIENSEDNHIIDISFEKSNISLEENEKLFVKISDRVNSRGQFKDEELFEEVSTIVELNNKEFLDKNISLTILKKKEDINKIAELTRDAILEAYDKPSFRKEVSHWMNSNLSRKKEGLPGYSLKLPLILSIIIPILIRYFNMGKILGNLNYKSIKSAPLIFIFSSLNNLKEDWINIGMYAEKLMLSLQTAGFQTSIFVGSIEIGDLYKDVQRLINLNSGRPEFIFAVGHMEGIHKITPRHKLEEKIIN